MKHVTSFASHAMSSQEAAADAVSHLFGISFHAACLVETPNVEALSKGRQ